MGIERVEQGKAKQCFCELQESCCKIMRKVSSSIDDESFSGLAEELPVCSGESCASFLVKAEAVELI